MAGIDKHDLDRIEKNIKEHVTLKTEPIVQRLDSMETKNEADHTALFSTMNTMRERVTRVETKQKTVFGFLAAVGVIILGVIGKIFIGGK